MPLLCGSLSCYVVPSTTVLVCGILAQIYMPFNALIKGVHLTVHVSIGSICQMHSSIPRATVLINVMPFLCSISDCDIVPGTSFLMRKLQAVQVSLQSSLPAHIYMPLHTFLVSIHHTREVAVLRNIDANFNITRATIVVCILQAIQVSTLACSSCHSNPFLLQSKVAPTGGKFRSRTAFGASIHSMHDEFPVL